MVSEGGGSTDWEDIQWDFECDGDIPHLVLGGGYMGI